MGGSRPTGAELGTGAARVGPTNTAIGIDMRQNPIRDGGIWRCTLADYFGLAGASSKLICCVPASAGRTRERAQIQNHDPVHTRHGSVPFELVAPNRVAAIAVGVSGGDGSEVTAAAVRDESNGDILDRFVIEGYHTVDLGKFRSVLARIGLGAGFGGQVLEGR